MPYLINYRFDRCICEWKTFKILNYRTDNRLSDKWNETDIQDYKSTNILRLYELSDK